MIYIQQQILLFFINSFIYYLKFYFKNKKNFSEIN